MNPNSLRPADESQLAALWPSAKAASLFGSPDELRHYWAEAPWRVLVTGRGEAAVLGSWRAHLRICAVRAMWCDASRVSDLMRQVFVIAAGQGFERALSPLVPEESAEAYRRSPMWEIERIVTMRLNPPEPSSVLSAPGIRPGCPADVQVLLSIDRASFDEFWRYDAETLGGYMGTERLAVAEENGRVIGYTLSTVKGPVGTLGRLAVAPVEQRRGVGANLLAEAIGWMTRRGVRSVTLCTQEHNAASRRLYARAGFKEMAGRLVFHLSGPLAGRAGS